MNVTHFLGWLYVASPPLFRGLNDFQLFTPIGESCVLIYDLLTFDFQVSTPTRGAISIIKYNRRLIIIKFFYILQIV